MKFHEKVKRRVNELGLNKAKAARDVGLPESTISNYLVKLESLPRIDIALKIAMALKVPLQWLADDNADFPVPEIDAAPLTAASDSAIMAEACRRLAVLCELFIGVLNGIEAMDWNPVAVEALAVPVDAPLPARLEKLLNSLHPLESEWSKLRMFDASHVLYMHVDKAPDVDRIRERVDRLANDEPAIRSLLKYLHLRYLTDAGKRHGNQTANVEMDAHRHKLLEQFRRELPPIKRPTKA